jgi:isocitrate dehydrogenase kinase/phosphatase
MDGFITTAYTASTSQYAVLARTNDEVEAVRRHRLACRMFAHAYLVPERMFVLAAKATRAVLRDGHMPEDVSRGDLSTVLEPTGVLTQIVNRYADIQREGYDIVDAIADVLAQYGYELAQAGLEPQAASERLKDDPHNSHNGVKEG